MMYNLSDTDRAWVNETWEKLDKKLKTVSERSRNKIPYTAVNGVHNDMAKEDVTWWTNGFWAGLMWLMYVDTRDGRYRETAERAEQLLDAAFDEYDKLHHDVGFMWLLSSGANYRITGNKKSRLRVLYAADTLMARYNAEGKFIRSWNGDDNKGWVIIDSMMNIPLLYMSGAEHDDPRYRYVAENHADTLLRTHIRDDGSVNHIVNLDLKTGEVIESIGGQGYKTGSSWSRGQSWAVYGYVLSYIRTGKQIYLDTAKKVAHYFIAAVAATDYVPRSDFRAPDETIIDTTAGACAACGLIEIANNVGEYERKMYLDAALKILKSLEKYCDFTDDNDSVLQMGTEAYPRERGRHIPIIYGDYFFAEALYKLRGNDLLFW